MAANAAPEEQAGSTFAPFRHRIFLAMWIAAVMASFGSLIQTVGAAWLMTSLSGSAEMVALVQTAAGLPVAIFALAAGAIADTYDRRRVMLLALTMTFVISVVLAIFQAAGLLTAYLLLGLTFLIGCCLALYLPAWQSSVSEQVPREDLPAAISLNSLAFNIARSLGPAIGGAVVTVGGAAMAFATNALCYLGLIGVVAVWRRPVVDNPLPRERIGPAMLTGLRYVWLSPRMRAMLVRALAFGFGGSSINALLPLVARDLIQGGPFTYGLLLGAFGAGSVMGALSMPRLRRGILGDSVVKYTAAAFGAAAAVVAFSPWMPLTMAALGVAGFCWVLALSTLNVTLQMAAPRWVVGRALASFQMVLFAGVAIGSWVWGRFAEDLALSASLAVSGVVLAATMLLGSRWRVPQTPADNLEPASAWTELDIRTEIDPATGPVILFVEYAVSEERVPGFLGAMAELRQIRRRDGARRWTLLQDLADPEKWIERFESPTWADHLHRHGRGTVADREVEERVIAFHHGADAPRVRQLIARDPAAGGPAAAPDEAPPKRVGVFGIKDIMQ